VISPFGSEVRRSTARAYAESGRLDDANAKQREALAAAERAGAGAAHLAQLRAQIER
jgi:hypothetical protein